MQAILIIDQGSHSSRALLYNLHGELLAQAQHAVTLQFPANAHVEFDAEEILRSIEQVLHDILGQANALAITHIQQAALIVQRSSLVVCNKSTMQALGAGISWMDTRHHAWLAQEKPYFTEIQRITGLYPNAHYAYSKIAALIAEHPHWRNADDIIFTPLASYLACKLSAQTHFLCDAVIASRTMLMDRHTLQWSEPLLKRVGINASALPKIVCSDHNFGTINCQGFAIPLRLVGGDQSFIAFSAGVDKAANYAFINIGSGAFVQQICTQPPQTTPLLISPLFIGQHSRYIALEGAVNAAATPLNQLLKEHTDLRYEQINIALQQIENPPIYHNTQAGTGSPFWLDARPATFSEQAEPLAQAAAILESVIFTLQDNLSLLAANQALVISGGLSRFTGFCQKLADLSQINVIRFEDYEASARGLAFFLLGIRAEQCALAAQTFEPQENKLLFNRYAQHRKAIALYAQ